MYRSSVGYPVFLLEGEDWVPGDVLEIVGPETLFLLLDELHGVNIQDPDRSLYFASEEEIHLENGKTCSAWIYHLNPNKLPVTAVRIPKGEWRDTLKSQPTIPERLSQKQVEYLKKLGTSSGRETVRIDLDLYRELMKLDLVVDKGRRIALTNLGKEVLKYL